MRQTVARRPAQGVERGAAGKAVRPWLRSGGAGEGSEQGRMQDGSNELVVEST